jgi:transposase
MFLRGESSLFIEYFKNSGKPYLRVAESYCVKINGVFKNRKRIIRNLGPLDKFDDGKPDFIPRLRESFKNGTPIIGGLSDLLRSVSEPEKVVIEFNKTDPNTYLCVPKNLGYFILDSLYDQLGIYDVLNLQKSRGKIEYDLNGIAKLLVFGRVLWPDSKKTTYEQKENYLFDVTSSDNLIHIYRALDVLNDKADTIQKRMNLKIAGGIGRNMSICYYDVTNYWFEIDDNDEDKMDEFGHLIKEGIRKRGPSKAKSRKPITQMGLFVDDKGIPVSYRIFPGNHIDQTTLRPALKNSIEKMGFGRVVIIADGGLNSGKNIARILEEGNGYVLSKSTKKSDKDTRKWILEEAGYEWNQKQTFKQKSKIRERVVIDEDGNKVTIKEKIISYWSEKHYEREVHENRKFIEYLESVIAFPDKLKDGEKKIEKFLKKNQVDKKTGKIVQTKTVLCLDMKKIQEYMDLMGYYTLLTSEIDMPDRDVIDKYHGLSRIEDSFRIIKSDLEGRPVYVQTPEHINAHFLICFIALTMIRIIQHHVLVYQGHGTLSADGWEAGVTAERIKKALGGFMADRLPGDYYRLTAITDDLALILKALHIDADVKLPAINELRKLKYNFDKNDFI